MKHYTLSEGSLRVQAGVWKKGTWESHKRLTCYLTAQKGMLCTSNLKGIVAQVDRRSFEGYNATRKGGKWLV